MFIAELEFMLNGTWTYDRYRRDADSSASNPLMYDAGLQQLCASRVATWRRLHLCDSESRKNERAVQIGTELLEHREDIVSRRVTVVRFEQWTRPKNLDSVLADEVHASCPLDQLTLAEEEEEGEAKGESREAAQIEEGKEEMEVEEEEEMEVIGGEEEAVQQQGEGGGEEEESAEPQVGGGRGGEEEAAQQQGEGRGEEEEAAQPQVGSRGGEEEAVQQQGEEGGAREAPGGEAGTRGKRKRTTHVAETTPLRTAETGSSRRRKKKR